MVFRRSTRDIVISRARKRKEAQEAAQLATQVAQEENNTQEARDALEQGASFAITEIPQEGEQEVKMEKIKKLTAYDWVKIAGGVILVALMVVLIGALIAQRGEEANTPQQSESSEATQQTIPEEMSVVALADAALAASVDAGDVVQLYDGDGVIAELSYVEVYGTSNDGLLLAINAEQMTAFARHKDVTAALVARAGKTANELLELQKSILHPMVTLELKESVELEPATTATTDFALTLVPENGICPQVRWESSDPNVVTVTEDGTLTAISEGEATVTVNCGEASASCAVTVRVPLTGIAIDRTEATLAVGETVQLVASAQPENATGFVAVWSSDNDAVAVVGADGTVTAVGAGSATITASSGEYQASCLVTVGVRTELVQLTQDEIVLYVSQSQVLEYAVSPAENNIDAVTFTSSDPSVATVAEDGTVTAIGYGVATITITHGGASDTCTVIVYT